jgi:hypothetical protein
MRIATAIFVTALLLAFVPASSPGQVAVGSVTTTTLTLADTEYSVNLGQGIKGFSVQARGGEIVRLAFVSGGTSSGYFTIKADSTYWSPTLPASPTLYLRSPDAGVVVEIEYWK